MITVSIDPILLSIGHFHLRWYSLIVLVAIAAGTWLVAREAARKGFPRAEIYDAAIGVILAGAVGARLFHVIDHWPDIFSANPIRALYIWEGGLAIWGAVAGGLVAVVFLARRKAWNVWRLLDAAAPGLVLAQAIGRLACIITGDSVGKPTDGPFGLAYSNPNAMVPKLGVYYAPMPIYEILMNLGILAVLWRLRRQKRLPDGVLFLVYLILYSAIRFVITFWSSYRVVAFGLNQSQLISLIALVIGVPWLVVLLRRNRVIPEQEHGRPHSARRGGAPGSQSSPPKAGQSSSLTEARPDTGTRSSSIMGTGIGHTAGTQRGQSDFRGSGHAPG
jgi:phosphatidylglycerol:prolipoprotein diacylglycerol transferase